MKRLLLLLLGSLLARPAAGQAAARTLEPAALAGHRFVAILPFEVAPDRTHLRDLRYFGPDTSAATTLRGQQQQQQWTAKQRQELRIAAYQLQALLYAQLLAQAPAQGYTVVFQPVAETNRLLLAAGIRYESFPSHRMPDLQRALGVDAIFSGQTVRYQAPPRGVGPAGARNEAVATLALHDCATGKLAWRLDLRRTGSAALTPERLTQDLVRAALPAFPYRRR